MTSLHLRRAFAGLALLCLLSACAPKPWDDPIQLTTLVRLAPEDFRVKTTVPKGLGETGIAYFRWGILTHATGTELVEAIKLVRVGTPERQSDGSQTVVYRLDRESYKTFQTQQIRQRAQLLAGYFSVGVMVIPDLCSMAGTSAGREHVLSVLYDDKTGEKITTYRVDIPASEIQPQVGFCV